MPDGNSPASFAAYVKDDIAKWKKVIEDAKITKSSAATGIPKSARRVEVGAQIRSEDRNETALRRSRGARWRSPRGSRAGLRPGGYPNKPVKIIVPFAPAGPTDIAARLIATEAVRKLKQQFFVENVAGAGGNIGMGQAAKAAPDGYTILFVSSSYVVNPSLYDKVPYDPYKDFRPLTVAATAANVLLVNPKVMPVEDVQGARRSRQGKSRQVHASRRPAPAPRRISPASCSS